MQRSLTILALASAASALQIESVQRHRDRPRDENGDRDGDRPGECPSDRIPLEDREPKSQLFHKGYFRNEAWQAKDAVTKLDELWQACGGLAILHLVYGYHELCLPESVYSDHSREL